MALFNIFQKKDNSAKVFFSKLNKAYNGIVTYNLDIGSDNIKLTIKSGANVGYREYKTKTAKERERVLNYLKVREAKRFSNVVKIN